VPGLMVEKGPDNGIKIKFEGKTLVVGRDPKLPFAIRDITTSRRHFRIDFIAKDIRLVDLDSRNGTYLNGSRIESPQILKIGDKIRIGETFFSLLPNEELFDPLLGKEFADYFIENRLGKGGMGIVYKAIQRSTQREVALKILSKEAHQLQKKNKNEVIDQFIREAQATSALSHPNIVQIYDVGYTLFEDQEVYYFSMEYCSKGSLQDLLGSIGKFSWKDSLPLILQTAEGLAYAETKRIIHRDIKPDNLMVTADHILKIGDLGLACTLGENSREEAIFGTAHFISPEQAQGKPLDHRADLYSLGATIFRLVTGETVFSGKISKEIVVKQIAEPPRDPRTLETSIPEPFAKMVLKLLEKDPNRRYRSAQELIVQLKRLDPEGSSAIRWSSASFSALTPQSFSFPKKLLGVALFLGILPLLVFFFSFFSLQLSRPLPQVKNSPSPQEMEAFTAESWLFTKKRVLENLLKQVNPPLPSLEKILQEYRHFQKQYQAFPFLCEQAQERQLFLEHLLCQRSFQRVLTLYRQPETPLDIKIENLNAFLNTYPQELSPHPEFKNSSVEQALWLFQKLKKEQADLLKAQEEASQTKERSEEILKTLRQILQEQAFLKAQQYLEEQEKKFPELRKFLDPYFAKIREQEENAFVQLQKKAQRSFELHHYEQALLLLKESPFNQSPSYSKQIDALLSEYEDQYERYRTQQRKETLEREQLHFQNLTKRIQSLLRFSTYEHALQELQQEKKTYQTEALEQEKQKLLQHLEALETFKNGFLKAMSTPSNLSHRIVILEDVLGFKAKTEFEMIGASGKQNVLLRHTQTGGITPVEWESLREKEIIAFIYSPSTPSQENRYRYSLTPSERLGLLAFLFQSQDYKKLEEEIQRFEQEKLLQELPSAQSLLDRYQKESLEKFQELLEKQEEKAEALLEELQNYQLQKKSKKVKELLKILKENYAHTQAFQLYEKK
jgi:serine/threonine protein kinase